MPSFKAVYREYFDFVWASGIRLGIERNNMDDVLQDVFMVIHARLDTLENPNALRSWIYGIVRRTASNYRRARRARASTHVDAPDLPESTSPAPTPLEQTERNAQQRLLKTLLDQLDEQKREILALVDVHELSVPEAAAALGIAVNTAYSRLRVARQGFEAALARHEAGDKKTT